MDDLILRSLQGRTTETEEQRLLEWRRASEANEREYGELAHVWMRTGELPRPAAAPAPTIEQLLALAPSSASLPTADQSRFLSFIGELKQRRVFRVAAAYAVAAWIVIQVATDVGPALRVPDWAVTLIVLLALLGFPVAVALAWAFDLTSGGIVRAMPAPPLIRSYAGRIAVAGAVVVLGLASGSFIMMRSDGADTHLSSGDVESRTVAVLPFSVRAGDGLHYLSAGMVELLSTELSSAGELVAVDPNRVISGTSGGEGIFDPNHGREIAARLGAALYVLGTVFEAGGRVRLTASVYDRSRGSHPLTMRAVEGVVADLLPLSKQLAVELAAGLTKLRQNAAVGVHLVWSGDGADVVGSPSPDGRLLSFTAWNSGGNLAIRELATGTNRQLTHKGDPGMDDQYAEWSRFSPDGRNVAYAWFTRDRKHELRVMGLADTAVHVAIEGHDWVAPIAWQSDGSRILAVVADSAHSHLVWTRLADGARDTVATDLWSFGVALSPDDRWIAYSVQVEDSTPHADIAVKTAAGRDIGVVVSGPGNDMALGWLPDGRGLLFWSDRGGVPSLWAIRVQDGRAQGTPVLVRADVSWPWAMGFAGDDFYYGVGVSDRQVYHAGIDVGAAQLVTAPEPAGHHSAGGTTHPSWSPDGSRLAYIVERPQSGLGSALLAVRHLATGAVREYPLDAAWPQNLEWLPDGSAILFIGTVKYRQLLHRMELASGRVDTLAIGGFGALRGAFELSADGRVVYLVKADRPGTVQLVRQELHTGAETVLVTNTQASNIIPGQPVAASRDGTQLAFAVRNRQRGRSELYVLPSTGGQRRLVHSIPVEKWFNSLEWTPDGQHLLFVSDNTLWRLRLSDGDVQRIFQMRGLRSLRLDADGRRIAFSAGERQSEVWRLENPGAVLGRN